MKLQDLTNRLGQDFDALGNAALARATETLANDVRSALSVQPGGPHDHPWLQTGGLRDSVTGQAEDAHAVVGSSSDVALYQEHGTATLPPRPSFAPVAAASGQAIAHHIAQAVVAGLEAR